MAGIAKKFNGKVAIVTGSTKGIGYSIAKRLGLEGASLVVSSRRQENVDKAVERLTREGIQEVSGFVCHVSNALHRKNMIDQVIQKYGKIDVIVLNAAVNPTPGEILKTPESAMDKLMDVNVKSSVLLLQEAAPHLTEGSSVVFISSISAYQPLPSLTFYGVAKAAVLGLTKALAFEMAPKTRVNCIAPGYVPTHFSGIVTDTDSLKTRILGNTLLKRPGTTEEIAAAVAFFASDDSSYITGETIVAAGGMHSRL